MGAVAVEAGQAGEGRTGKVLDFTHNVLGVLNVPLPPFSSGY